MAKREKASNKKNLKSRDSQAGMGQETENPLMEDVIAAAETEQEQLVVSDGDTNTDDSGSLVESAGYHEWLKADNSEIDMNAVADLPEDRDSDETKTDGVAEPSIMLDAMLTIQHVAKLYEQLKNSYSANNAIEINASQVSSIDTATLQLLVALKKDAVKQQKEVVLVEPSRRFIESAELLGLLEILDIDT
jgi:anti-anti-sigma regulatory factor